MIQETSTTNKAYEPLSKVDKERLKASMDRLFDIYRQIGEVATQVSTWRCPYKDRKDRCTAQFGCRHQSRKAPDELLLCTGSDKLDYRDAWEV